MSRAASVGGVDVSRETFDRLKAFESLVHRWNPTINLVSRSTLACLWGRHIDDSAQLFRHVPESCTNLADLGSGGGFPGVVLAIMSEELTPHRQIDLVESDSRKAAFLSTAIRQLSLSAKVSNARAEVLPNQSYDAVTSRALAPLAQLVDYAFDLLRPDGVAVFPKGRNHAEELEQALEKWRFSVQKHKSLTAHDAVVFVIKDIQRA